MSKPILLSLGSINADFTFEVDADLGAGGTIQAKSFFRRSGGKAANVAAFARHLGASAKLLGRVGDDVFAEQALQPLRKLEVDLSGVSVAAGQTTGIAMIGVPKDGNKTILLATNANESWDAEALENLQRHIETAPASSVLALDFEVSRAAIEVAIGAATGRGMPIVADASFPERVEPRDLARLHAVSPNASEAGKIIGRTIQGDEDANAAARQLAASGVKLAYVKLANGGCVMAEGSVVTTLAAPNVEVVDKTGAGDAFTAAIAIALMETRSAREAGQWGVAASTLAVMRAGSQESYPDRQRFQDMLRQVAEANNG